MSGRFLRYAAVVILLIGVAMLTFYDPTPEVGKESVVWVVPVAYFLMVIGAVILCWGWFRGRAK